MIKDHLLNDKEIHLSKQLFNFFTSSSLKTAPGFFVPKDFVKVFGKLITMEAKLTLECSNLLLRPLYKINFKSNKWSFIVKNLIKK